MRLCFNCEFGDRAITCIDSSGYRLLICNHCGIILVSGDYIYRNCVYRRQISRFRFYMNAIKSAGVAYDWWCT